MKKFRIKLIIALCGLALAAASPRWAGAHAFPDHAEPRVGAVISISPTRVRIWFDGVLEPLFSTLQVRNTSGQPVDRGDGHVDASDQTLLEISLPHLPPDTYRVFWSVVARDGHRTQGDYTFTLR
ncbi:MAG TPA: copper resistance CopC family protein [Burkholderiales bacterium]|nr:copper resistance CopC family protein [Burkholderiales bacterium]